MTARVVLALAAILLALPLVPAPNVPVDPNVSFINALSVPISTPSQERPDVEFSLTTQSGNPQYLFFDVPAGIAVSSIDVRVKASGAKEFHVTVRQGAIGSHCDHQLSPSVCPYYCNSSGFTSNEGHIYLPYPQIDRYFVTVNLDSTADASKSASFKVRTTVSSCPGSKAGPGCAAPVFALATSQKIEGYVPANTYKYYTFKQPSGAQFTLSFEKGVCANPTDTVMLFRALAPPNLETTIGFPYYDLSLTCQDAPQVLDLIAPVAGDYWFGFWGGSQGANFTYEFTSFACPPDQAGSDCQSGEWFPIGQNAGPWCVEGGISEQCKELEYSLSWDHSMQLNFSPIPPGWNYFALQTLPEAAYSFKVVVAPTSRDIPFTVVAMRNNIPVVYPQLTGTEAWAYYNVSDPATALTILNVPYPAAGDWWVGILADPNTFGNESVNFAITATHYMCFQNCTNGGTCQTATTQCKCKSGRGGPSCSVKTGSHAGAIVGAIFGVLGGIALIALGVWYFFMRPKTSYEMI